jgi:hypothetical protein
MVAAAALLTGVFLPIHAIAADYTRTEGVADTQPPVHTHDLAVVSIKAPKKVTLSSKKPTVVKSVKVAIQNRSPYTETIPDQNTLSNLVSLSVVPQSAGSNCSTPFAALDTGKPQPVLPVTLKPNKKLKIDFDVTFTCAVDPLKGSGHEDFRYIAQVDASALDGQEDVNPASDVCPRPPIPVIDGSTTDKGCGGKLPGKILGGPVLSDVILKDVSATYSIMGTVTNAVTGAAISGVSISLTGSTSMTTVTNANGEYTFTGLSTGNYLVTASLANFIFGPSERSITVGSASVTDESFIAIPDSLSLIASGISFLPDVFLSLNQLRASLVVSGGNIFFTDSSDQPLKKISLSDLVITPLAQRIGSPENVVLHDQSMLWVDGSHLNVTSLDGSGTTLLASGERDAVSGVTADIVVDDSYAYWVNTVSSPSCSPSCTWIIQRVPLAGGTPLTLATVNRRIVSLTADANNIFWEEASLEPLEPGCECGSSIKMVPKSGGTPVVLVDGTLNGSLPLPPPGNIPASWWPTGGLAVNASQIIFGMAENSNYQIKTVSISGGAVSTLSSVASTAGFALAAIRNLSGDGTYVYWIDSVNRTLNAIPVGGGNITVLASDLVLPSDLNTQAALTITADSAYWTEPGTVSGCCFQMETGRIRTVSLSGGVVSTVVSNLDTPAALAVDQQNLVWAENWRIAKAFLGDSSIATLASGLTTDMPRIAVGQNDVYVLDGDYIKKMPTNGGTLEKLASAHGGKIQDLSVQNQDIATDGSNVYWTSGLFGYGPSVQKVSTLGGTAITLAVPQGSADGPQDCYWRIVVDGKSVYWSSTSSQFPVGCTIKMVPINGDVTTTLVDFAYLRDFTVDGTNVYFSELGTNPGSIQKISANGGPITTVKTNIVAWVLANDGNNIYWIDPGLDGGIGVISKAEQQGGAFDGVLLGGAVFTDPFLAAEGITVEQGNIYWTETLGGDIYSIK